MATKVPTATNIQKAKTAFESMDYQKQQDFIAKNKDFDVSKLGFKLQTAPVVTPTDNKLLPNQTSKDKFVDPISSEQQKNNTGMADTSAQQNNISNIPENTIKESQKNDVISTPTEVKTDKVETPTNTGPSKTDNSQQRLTEIQTNLQNYANNPDFQQYFKTQDAFNNYFGREQRTPEQQKVLDSFYTGYKAEQDKRVKDNARYLTLSTMSDTDLQNVNDINDISLINLDQNLKARYDAAQKNKQIMEFVYGKDYGKTDTTPDGIDGIAGNYSEEYTKAAGELTATKSEMDKIQDTMDSTYDNLVKQYEGTGETDSYIRAKAAKLNSELTNQYNDLARKYNTQLGTVTALQATEDRKREEQATNIALANQKMQMYNFLYGTPSAQKEEIPIQTKDFGTTKKPDWRQSLDGGKTRQPISGISGGGTAGGGTSTGGGTGGGGGEVSISGNTATTLLNDPNLSKSVGVMSYLGEVRGTAQYAFKSKVDNYINTLVLPKLKYLKGATSDKDIDFIRSAATSLNVGLDEATFRQTLKDMGAVLSKYDSNGNPISQKTQTQQPSTIVNIIPDNNILAKDSKLTPQPAKQNGFQKIGETKTVKFIKNLFK